MGVVSTALEGNGGRDRLYGGARTDVVHGQDGPDRLHGGNGSDYLSGGKADDRLFGRRQGDILHGGKQRDVCAGGPPHISPSGNRRGDLADRTCEVFRSTSRTNLRFKSSVTGLRE